MIVRGDQQRRPESEQERARSCRSPPDEDNFFYSEERLACNILCVKGPSSVMKYTLFNTLPLISIHSALCSIHYHICG